MNGPFDLEGENRKFNTRRKAQQDKMRKAEIQDTAEELRRENEPNAGGGNRESGDRSGR